MITCCSIYLFRDIIISTLFTEGFAQARVLFAGQMVGDFFKICAWIIGYVFISKAQVKMFISMEIGFSALLCGLTYFFTEHQGFIGVSIAYAVNYFIYFICVLIILNTKKNEH